MTAPDIMMKMTNKKKEQHFTGERGTRKISTQKTSTSIGKLIISKDKFIEMIVCF